MDSKMLKKSVWKAPYMVSIVTLLLTSSVNFVKTAPNGFFDMIILHSNDMHARFLPIDSSMESHQGSHHNSTGGYGGFARVSYVVKQYRRANKNGGVPVMYLDAGDIFMGSRWFNLFHYKVTADFMNILNPDAMCLGNHEFDYGIDTLIPFLNRVKFPVLFANIANYDHPLYRTRSLMPSAIFRVKGHKIGVIGYLTPETKEKAPGCDVEFSLEILAVNQEARALQRHGVNIIIALGHSGFKRDLEIAANCPLVDLVIGGHTHKFLYTGQQPDKEKIEAPYPTVIQQRNGKKVPVVTAFAYTKYLGQLQLRFDYRGNLISWAGKPILLSSSVPQDPEVLALQKEYSEREAFYSGPPIGESKLQLSDLRCRLMECGLGNMLTDSFVIAAKDVNNTHVALITSGAIRSGLRNGTITRIDLEEIIPFRDSLVIVNISGRLLLQALEYSVRKYCEQRFIGTFLQMSGLRVVFSVDKHPGNRVVSVKIRTSESTYEKVDLLKNYNVVITSFMFRQNFGYNMFKRCRSKLLSISTMDAFKNYIEFVQVINPLHVHEGRIKVLNQPPLQPNSPPYHSQN
ncbi:protein 5NUC-like [Contarinia nasturtii]|uniref:protein 5NUC-like n=1 Tax=Contarinia nasturtii TaxID=265458 RepID=UPI0012D3A037|nr:protein 5NUC-like [Contarinia nasturtii]